MILWRVLHLRANYELIPPPSCMCHNTIMEVKNHLNSHLKYPHDNYNILCPKPDLHSQGRVTHVSLYHRRDVTYIHRYQL